MCPWGGVGASLSLSLSLDFCEPDGVRWLCHPKAVTVLWADRRACCACSSFSA